MKKLIMLGLAVLGLMTSCSNDELVTVSPANSSKEIAFSTHVDKVTRATDRTTGNIKDFHVYGYTKTTKATEWTKIFDNEEVTKGTDGWSYSNIQYWTEGNAYIFHALNDNDDDGLISFKPSSDDGYTKATIEFDNQPNDVAGTTDLVYAYTKIEDAQKTEDSFATVKLNFKHLLSRVKFRFVAVDGDNPEDNPVNALYNVKNVRLVGAYKTAKIVVDGSEIDNGTKWDNIKWTGYSKDNLIHEDDSDDIGDGLRFCDVEWSNSSEEKKLNQCYYYINENEDSNEDSYYYFGNTGQGETGHWYVIPVDAADQSGYKVTFKVNLILATDDSTDEHTTGEFIEATGTADLSTVAIDMQIGYSYVYTIKINAAKLKFTDENQTHDPIVFDDITVTSFKTDTNDWFNASKKTDATAE